MITASIEIARKPEEVFAYIDQVERHGEWQERLLKARKDPPGPTHVGTRNIETRRMPGGPREFITEITEYDPPRRISFRGIDGPVRPQGTITIEPAGNGSRYTFQFDLVGRGVGKLFAVMGRRVARKQIPIDQVRLKERLESGK